MTLATIQMLRLKGIEKALPQLDRKTQCMHASWEFGPLCFSWRCIARICITGQRRALNKVDRHSASGPSLAALSSELR